MYFSRFLGLFFHLIITVFVLASFLVCHFWLIDLCCLMFDLGLDSFVVVVFVFTINFFGRS